ncbi:hypothetical protein P7K49_038180 [Saguinus oedipus]|uniref:Uncharacterized protein n=1 Tax=Saguinus oedipus TaxID=9490 RepID=A0ABQ9TDZ1_SAGOE|nr:hypothetical protein P7K49_038180 [Saguinus oedipus]
MMTPRQFITSAMWGELLSSLVSEEAANSSVRARGGVVHPKVLVHEITQEKGRSRQKQRRQNPGLQGVIGLVKSSFFVQLVEKDASPCLEHQSADYSSLWEPVSHDEGLSLFPEQPGHQHKQHRVPSQAAQAPEDWALPSIAMITSSPYTSF